MCGGGPPSGTASPTGVRALVFECITYSSSILVGEHPFPIIGDGRLRELPERTTVPLDLLLYYSRMSGKMSGFLHLWAARHFLSDPQTYYSARTGIDGNPARHFLSDPGKRIPPLCSDTSTL